MFFFFFNDTATTEIYTLSLHDALPILLDQERDGIENRVQLRPARQLEVDGQRDGQPQGDHPELHEQAEVPAVHREPPVQNLPEIHRPDVGHTRSLQGVDRAKMGTWWTC